MFGFMVTADGGLTTAGYVITVIAGIILFFLAIYFAGKNSDKKKLTTRQLVFCAVAIALAFITSYLKIFELPWVIIPGLFEPPVRTLRATIPENESHIFR